MNSARIIKTLQPILQNSGYSSASFDNDDHDSSSHFLDSDSESSSSDDCAVAQAVQYLKPQSKILTSFEDIVRALNQRAENSQSITIVKANRLDSWSPDAFEYICEIQAGRESRRRRKKVVLNSDAHEYICELQICRRKRKPFLHSDIIWTSELHAQRKVAENRAEKQVRLFTPCIAGDHPTKKHTKKLWEKYLWAHSVPPAPRIFVGDKEDFKGDPLENLHVTVLLGLLYSTARQHGVILKYPVVCSSQERTDWKGLKHFSTGSHDGTMFVLNENNHFFGGFSVTNLPAKSGRPLLFLLDSFTKLSGLIFKRN
jgi:hypothetical protein